MAAPAFGIVSGYNAVCDHRSLIFTSTSRATYHFGSRSSFTGKHSATIGGLRASVLLVVAYTSIPHAPQSERRRRKRA